MKMEDVARLAGVSKSSVSLAISGKPGISQETRLKILEIVKESGYLPRGSVKPEKTYGISHTLRFVACVNSGIVLEQYSSQPFFMELIHDIEEQCRVRGYSLFFSSVPMDRFEHAISALEAEHESNGMILLGTNLTREQISHVAQKQPNLVVLDTCFETLNVNFIVMNNVMGAYQAGRHLLDGGHRRIGYVQSHSRMYNFDCRKKGFMQALAEDGLSVGDRHIFSVSPVTIASQEEFKRSIAGLTGPLPTALFCECDYIAISVIKSLAELGIRVPEDISVIGFDNIQESMIVTPELTTVHVEKAKIAELAVSNLLAMIENRGTVRTKSFIDTQLVVRNSSRGIEGALLPQQQ
ncbi:substrate-binding domain-containing protein [Paenibacillus hamazuiensis]|uniref:substrate-binding domain-containing protein n=1 Tax=Paenibacillus hamazuiensis TaxID=2936508 RepID=UPI00200F9D57|nr:substrate-binding domain-containing protein [Paenibacillus hamazuiensis]